jgi:hypothetical protein
MAILAFDRIAVAQVEFYPVPPRRAYNPLVKKLYNKLLRSVLIFTVPHGLVFTIRPSELRFFLFIWHFGICQVKVGSNL